MPQNDHLPPQPRPIHSIPSLNIVQFVGLAVELRDLAVSLIEQQRQLTELLQRGRTTSENDLKLLTITEVAQLLACDDRTVHRRIRSGELDAVRDMGMLRVTLSSLRAYIERNRVDGNGGTR